MSSFQSAHKVANELAEVLVTTAPIATAGWTTSGSNMLGGTGAYHLINTQKTVAGKNYRVLEVGYTVVRPGTNNGLAGQGLNSFSVGTVEATSYGGDADAYVQAGDIPATPAKAANYSTSLGGADALSFRVAGSGNVDSGGYPFLNSGDLLSVFADADVTNGPFVVFYARLAPVISKDVFA